MAERRISPWVVGGIAAGVVGAAAAAIYVVARAAPPTPPEGYQCPYCPESFDTYEDLVAHVTTEHPGERIPIHIIWQ